MNPKADFYFEKNERWQKELEKLRTIILDCGLNEEVKWGTPCYTYNGGNVCLVHVFKEYCAILFMKGALLSDPNGILVQQTENVQAARQLRFTSAKEISGLATTIKAYIYEAIENERAGLEVKLKKTDEFKMPEEFREKLAQDPALKTAFEALTPGRQRGYLLYFASAKQPKTRESRIEKYIPQILDGKGLED
ncbi:YdeI family protein [uncultured Chitinophaga sp.]|uniref:YdeI/OmpD-associated family protein n=1 Tax=uncultured Chitinophaga sp. TaxID=339340 RepID=UPI0025E54EBD|nr:YdeI/OmpD-associated family protein [uncultured Chitinophaga sp.]